MMSDDIHNGTYSIIDLLLCVIVRAYTQQRRDIEPFLDQCWAEGVAGGGQQ